MSDPWWVGWASAGVCTLGWLSLAVRTGASQRQAKLMQRGPIIAGPVEGDAAVLAAAQRFQQGGGEWLSRKAGAWDCSPARPKGGLFSVCSDAGGKHAFQGSTQILALCVCGGEITTGKKTQLMLGYSCSSWLRIRRTSWEGRVREKSKEQGQGHLPTLVCVCDFGQVPI